MLPKLFRARKRTAFCKYAIVLVTCFVLIIWWGTSQTPVPNINLALPESVVQPAGIGLDDLKKIQDKIIKEAEVELQPKNQEVVLKKNPIVVPKPKTSFSKYDLEIAADLAKIQPGLGDGGKGINIFLPSFELNNKANFFFVFFLGVRLTGEDQDKATEIMKKEAFNLLVSDRISYNRSLPDVRDSMCKTLSYDTSLPSSSVIIIFTNEAWSPLIRTIWSVITRSPSRYLKEILLIDDFSDRVELQGKLERYIETHFADKVRLVRLKERQGLIRARLAGAKEATGDVIIFLDSHCEVQYSTNPQIIQHLRKTINGCLLFHFVFPPAGYTWLAGATTAAHQRR